MFRCPTDPCSFSDPRRASSDPPTKRPAGAFLRVDSTRSNACRQRLPVRKSPRPQAGNNKRSKRRKHTVEKSNSSEVPSAAKPQSRPPEPNGVMLPDGGCPVKPILPRPDLMPGQPDLGSRNRIGGHSNAVRPSSHPQMSEAPVPSTGVLSADATARRSRVSDAIALDLMPRGA